MANAGLPIHKLQEFLGHADMATTQAYYLGLGEDFSDLVMKAVG